MARTRIRKKPARKVRSRLGSRIRISGDAKASTELLEQLAKGQGRLFGTKKVLSSSPFSDRVRADAAQYLDTEVDVNNAFADELAGDVKTELHANMVKGKSGWWNPVLVPITDLERAAVIAASMGNWLDAAIFAAMVHVRRKA